MIRYITSILAVIIAAGAVAFTSVPNSKTHFTNVRFEFNNATGGESQPSNWTYAPSASCSSVDHEACVIEVPDQVVSQAGSTFVIDPNKLNANYGFTTLPMVSDANGTRPDPSEDVYLSIENKN
jgi:hypothetical protein